MNRWFPPMYHSDNCFRYLPNKWRWPNCFTRVHISSDSSTSVRWNSCAIVEDPCISPFPKPPTNNAKNDLPRGVLAMIMCAIHVPFPPFSTGYAEKIRQKGYYSEASPDFWTIMTISQRVNRSFSTPWAWSTRHIVYQIPTMSL